jgi:hypothetical protein|tara:strand:+ start:84 stop:431 length:348 start_codon:yes stop_codon:yes gene_type:complete
MRACRYFLHVGQSIGSIPSQEKLLDEVADELPAEEELPHEALVGLIKVRIASRPSHATPLADPLACALQVSHSVPYAQAGSDVWAHGPVCNIIEDAVILDEPILDVKGALSLWQV